MVDDEVEQRREVFLRPLRLGRHPSIPARPVEHGKVELLVVGIEVREEIEHLVQHVQVTLVGPVDLVDRNDRPHAACQSLGNHELGLW